MEEATRIVLGRIARTGWPEHDGEPCAADVNSGRCVEWAELVCAAVPGTQMVEWDDPASQLLHTFVYWQDRWYDAERPDGAADVTGLPIFHRYPGTRIEGAIHPSGSGEQT
jgi:hypothetical protein